MSVPSTGCHSTRLGFEVDGLCQPRSDQARKKGVKTLNGSPSFLSTWPGDTAYGLPVRTSGMSPSA